MKKDKKKSNFGKIIAMVIYIAVCGAIGFFGAQYVDNTLADQSKTAKIIFILLLLVFLYVSLFVHIIIHEGGHLVFGLLSGYEFASFRVGSMMFVKKKDGIKVKRFSLMGTGGQCLMYIKDYNDGNFPYKLYNMGGALMNVIFSAISIVIYLFVKDNRYVSSFLIIFAVIGLLSAVMNGVPMSIGPVDNDGKNAVSLGKNKEARRCFFNSLKMNALLTNEIRLKDMDDDIFVIPDKEYLENRICSSTAAFAVSREMDKMDFIAAMETGHYALDNIESLTPLYKNAIKSELIYCEAVDGSIEKAEELLDKEVKKFASASKKNISVIRTQYAYSLLHDKDEEKAAKYLENFNKYAQKHPHQCEVESERELISCAKARYDKVMADMGE